MCRLWGVSAGTPDHVRPYGILQHYGVCAPPWLILIIEVVAAALQAHLPGVTDLCVHAGLHPLHLAPTEVPGGQLDQVCSAYAQHMCTLALSMSLSRVRAHTYIFHAGFHLYFHRRAFLLRHAVLRSQPVLQQVLCPRACQLACQLTHCSTKSLAETEWGPIMSYSACAACV